ncbi:hypothetical protein ABZ419_11645 [Streptomyces cinnamoneus]|uniref:hypothetical protein n=1 Tax=Streptomyces cinnamoneus TaxID=53446 RepID=UPI0033D3D08C
MPHQPRIVVYPPDQTGGRRVRADGEILGMAYTTRDLEEFLRRAGLEPGSYDITDATLIEWRGGGPEEWGMPR